MVDAGLQGLELPFDEVATPPFDMTVQWQMDDLLNYLGTWSSSKRYRIAKGIDPTDLVKEELAAAWGEPERVRKVTWPVDLRLVRK